MWWLWIILTLLILALMCCTLLYWIGTKFQSDKTQEILDSSPYRQKDPPPRLPLNDPLARNKVYEKKRAELKEMGVIKYDPHHEAKISEEPQIVGLAQPKGFWTKFIMGQKMGYIKMRMSLHKGPSGSFWRTLIKAQASSQGKSQGRGR